MKFSRLVNSYTAKEYNLYFKFICLGRRQCLVIKKKKTKLTLIKYKKFKKKNIFIISSTHLQREISFPLE